jgi:membrane protein
VSDRATFEPTTEAVVPEAVGAGRAPTRGRAATDNETNESRSARRWSAARRWFEGSVAYDAGRKLNALDFANQAMLLGAGLLVSLLPFLILLSAFANERVDDNLARHLGLDRRASTIVTHLFTSSPARLNVATATSLLFVFAGTLAVASSLQQIYEKVFYQPHRGMRNFPRLLIWIAVLCGVLAFESVVGPPVRDAPGGSELIEIVTFVVLMPFFWWTMHFLLAGRVGWWRLLPSAVATGAFFGLLGIFSSLYFSSTIISDSNTYGSIGAVFSIMTWLIAVGAVIVLGAVTGAAWYDRRHQARYE